MLKAMIMLLLMACGTQGSSVPAPPAGDWANVAPAEVKEVLSGDGRLYLRIEEGRFDFWVAVAQMKRYWRDAIVGVACGVKRKSQRGPSSAQLLADDVDQHGSWLRQKRTAPT